MSNFASVLDNPNDSDWDAAASGEDAGAPACSKCNGALPTQQTTVCPHCGWYAALGVHVEVEQEWEQAAAGGSQSSQKSHLEVWTTLVPAWAWVMVGTALAIIGGSVAVRVAYPEIGGVRTWWAIWQLIGGIAGAVICHFIAFLAVATSDPNIGMLDIVVSPFKVWRKLLGRLPGCLTITNTANASVVSAACAAGIIGGIPYDKLLEWDIDAPVGKSLLGAVLERASATQGSDMSMEDAISSFAGDAAGGGNLDGAPKPGSKNASAPVARKKIDALILGYEVDAAGRLSRLLIASERKGKLVYSGRVTPQLDAEAMAELTAKLRSYRAPRPIINVPTQATWVQPRLTCRVSYERRVESGVLTSLMWEKLLSEMKLPW